MQRITTPTKIQLKAIQDLETLKKNLVSFCSRPASFSALLLFYFLINNTIQKHTAHINATYPVPHGGYDDQSFIDQCVDQTVDQLNQCLSSLNICEAPHDRHFYGQAARVLFSLASLAAEYFDLPNRLSTRYCENNLFSSHFMQPQTEEEAEKYIEELNKQIENLQGIAHFIKKISLCATPLVFSFAAYKIVLMASNGLDGVNDLIYLIAIGVICHTMNQLAFGSLRPTDIQQYYNDYQNARLLEKSEQDPFFILTEVTNSLPDGYHSIHIYKHHSRNIARLLITHKSLIEESKKFIKYAMKLFENEKIIITRHENNLIEFDAHSFQALTAEGKTRIRRGLKDLVKRIENSEEMRLQLNKIGSAIDLHDYTVEYGFDCKGIQAVGTFYAKNPDQLRALEKVSAELFPDASKITYVEQQTFILAGSYPTASAALNYHLKELGDINRSSRESSTSTSAVSTPRNFTSRALKKALEEAKKQMEEEANIEALNQQKEEKIARENEVITFPSGRQYDPQAPACNIYEIPAKKSSTEVLSCKQTLKIPKRYFIQSELTLDDYPDKTTCERVEEEIKNTHFAKKGRGKGKGGEKGLIPLTTKGKKEDEKRKDEKAAQYVKCYGNRNVFPKAKLKDIGIGNKGGGRTLFESETLQGTEDKPTCILYVAKGYLPDAH